MIITREKIYKANSNSKLHRSNISTYDLDKLLLFLYIPQGCEQMKDHNQKM